MTEKMFGVLLKAGAVLAFLFVSAAHSYADDPTGVLEQERGLLPKYPGPVPAFTDGGPCYQGMHSEPFPNLSGFRCVRDWQSDRR
jgi:hypothetical protein